MKIKEKFRDKLFIKRQIGVIIGVVMLGLGVALLLMTRFGTDPFSSLCVGISLRTGISYGFIQMSANLTMMIAVLLFGRGFIGIGTFFNMFCIGYIADFFTLILKKIIVQYAELSLLTRLIVLVPAMIIFLLGAVFYMTASAGVAPYDAIPMMVSVRLKKIPFRFIRMTWDALFTLMSFLIGGPLGAITLLIILTLGPTVTYLGRFIGSRFYGTKNIE